MLIFPVTLFELIEIEIQCSKNYFKLSLSQEAGASGNNIEKEPKKATPKIEKIYISNIHSEYLLCPQSKATGIFLQMCIDFVEQQLKYSHFEGSIIH